MNILRYLTIILCLSFVSVSVMAQGGGGFTVDPATHGGWNGAGTEPADISPGGDTDVICISGMPDWYAVDVIGCTKEYIGEPVNSWICNCPPKELPGDTDGDGCTDIQEYNNYIDGPLADPFCLCEDDGLCNDIFNPERPEECNNYCSNLGEEGIGSVPEINGAAIAGLLILVFGGFLIKGHFHKK